MPIQVSSVRFGLATNSSSSHSLVFLPDGNHVSDNAPEDMEYGWEGFVLASKEAKLAYLAAMFKHGFEQNLPRNIIDLLSKSWIGATASDGAYVDHQSCFGFPSEYGNRFPDEQFMRELCEYLCDDRLVICGGNDNCGDDEAPFPGFRHFKLPLPETSNEYQVCRKESSGFWIIFDKVSGAKIRFKFVKGEEPTTAFPGGYKADTPELLDIKITDWCDAGCQYCYQGSSPHGKRETAIRLDHLADALAELKVFEVALGGGEPMAEAEEFVGVLRDFKEAGITPNFSTRRMEWLMDPSVWIEVMENCGSFALSVGSGWDAVKTIGKLSSLVTINGIEPRRVGIQAIVGSRLIESEGSLGVLMEACSQAGFRLTLLAYKQPKNQIQEPWRHMKPAKEWLVDAIKKSSKEHPCYVGIDTPLAMECEDGLKAAGVPRLMYSTKEGDASCYIDAVEGLIGPSSYCPPEQMVKLDKSMDLAEQIRANFAKF